MGLLSVIDKLRSSIDKLRSSIAPIHSTIERRYDKTATRNDTANAVRSHLEGQVRHVLTQATEALEILYVIGQCKCPRALHSLRFTRGMRKNQCSQSKCCRQLHDISQSNACISTHRALEFLSKGAATQTRRHNSSAVLQAQAAEQR